MIDRLISLARWSIVMVIVIVSAVLMLNAAISDSAIVDEVAHISAGYSYLKFLDYRLNPEHPPLVKMLAAAPLLFQPINFPLQSLAWNQGANDEWNLGDEFLYKSGNNADQILLWARLGPILLTLLLILIIYFWAKEIIGRWWALLPTFLFGLSPLVLSHGHYVTTDIGATLGIVGATAMFLRFLFHPTKKMAALAGLVLGLALLMKFSAVILIPYFLFLALVYTSVEAWRGDRGRYFKLGILLALVALLVVYVAYFITTLHYPVDRQLADTQHILSSFPAWIIQNPVLRPIGHYLLGLFMTYERSMNGNTLYFLGETSTGSATLTTGSAYWYYFPVVFLLKEPIASLVLIILAGALAFWDLLRSTFKSGSSLSVKIKEYLTTHFTEFAMGSFVVIYWTYAMLGNLNIGFRHILPTLPFIYILTAGVIKRWLSSENMARGSNLVLKIIIVSKELFSLSLKTTILVVLLLWYATSVILATPSYLSYFNFAGGGLTNGYKNVVDSNYDWGQDLRRLATYIDNVNRDDDPENDIDRIAVDYFGGGDPKYYLGDLAENWWSARGNPRVQGIQWLALSANTLQVSKGELTDGSTRKPEDEYRWLLNPDEPFARAGTSIFIYKL
ncbi:MAG: hypothetical protein G01um10143_456 [Parcubacteria group bacterium Gr01-1014_3]|nr:MAG: hypothetical protein G01um10143_456 [Parcubacteria group bacterium Gr01-1014_3]